MRENDQYVKPHRIADEYYYVGTRKGPANLLVTDAGLVLIDTSYPESYDVLLANIRDLGFDPADVRHIVHSHGHLDHYGCTAALVKLTGAKTYIGADDVRAVRGEDPYQGAFGSPCSFEPDVLLHDGDVISFGSVSIRFVATPGHTYGVMSMFLTLHVNGAPHLAGMFGGAGLNTLSDEFFAAHPHFPKTMRELYVQSIDKILNEPVEIHLGNHLGDNNGKEKMLHADDPVNPYLAENTWRPFLLKRRTQVEQLIRGE